MYEGNFSFKPLPHKFKRLRRNVIPKDFARFYGLYVTKTGYTKRFSFQLRIDLSVGGKPTYTRITATCNRILDKWIPLHEQGQIFDTFNELHRRTSWVKVAKIKNYKVGLLYG